jgi:hypothetical protein
MKNRMKLIFAAITSSLLAGCSGAYDEDLDASPVDREDLTSPQGTGLQGTGLQGTGLQGTGLQGTGLQGEALKGITLQSFANVHGPISNVSLAGTSFSGTDSTGKLISGKAFIGSTVAGVRPDGSTIKVRIESIQTSAADTELELYSLAWFDGSAWTTFCGESNGVPITAIPLEGRWRYESNDPAGGDHVDDPTMFTFACQSGVLAKCVNFGYKPWGSVTECNGGVCQTLPRRYFHQACTRMARADYCGRGTPHTANGTLINVYDQFGIQADESDLPLEAEWTSEGAKCVKHVRWTTGGQSVADAAMADILANCPETQSTSAKATCGTSYSTYTTTWGFATPIAQRALIRNESSSPPTGDGTEDGND